MFLTFLQAFAIFFCENNLRNLQCLKFQKQSREDSSLYAKKSDHVSLELETLVLNVNLGYNKVLMERCRQLNEYAQYNPR